MALLERLWRGWRITPLLTFVIGRAVALSLTLVTAFDIVRQRQVIRKNLEETGRLVAESWGSVFADSLYLGDVERLRRVSESLQLQTSILAIEVFDASGRVVAAAEPRDAEKVPLTEELVAMALGSADGVIVDRDGRLAVLSAISAGSQIIGGVRLHLNTSTIDAELRAMLIERLWQGLAMLVIGLALSHSLAHSLTRPVRSLIEATRQVASGELIFSADRNRRDELGDLMVAFDEMAGKLRLTAEAQATEQNERLEQINARLRDEVDKRKQAQHATEQTNIALGEQIAWRSRLERERERVIAELESRNTEMEHFTYTVSHDLKSPLVTIRGFIGLLRGQVGSGDLAAMRHGLARVDAAADLMQQLLDELLELSRVGRVINEPVDIDMRELAQQAVDLVEGEARAAKAELDVAADLPMARGDRHRILEVLENLLANAIKFSREGGAPRIHVGSRETEEGGVYFVSDDGIGIEARYADKIFGLFERLDSSTPGTGIGLALVKRIVELHGGRIWVESEGVGQGSTFCFTLKAPQSAAIAG